MNYFFENIYGEYRLYNITYEIGDSVTSDTDEIEQEENDSLNKNVVINNSINTTENEDYDYSKLESLTEDTVLNIYDENVDSIVMLNSYKEGAIVHTATGFIFADGFVVTTWNFMEQALSDSQYLIIRDNNDNLYELDGIVSIDTNLDMVILKLADKEKSNIELGNSEDLQEYDPIISINTKTGFKLSVMSGIIAENNDEILKNVLTLAESDEGSPIFNENGEVVGMNTSQSINSNVSIAYSTNALIELKKKLESQNFEDVVYISFDSLKEKYFYNKNNTETVVNEIGNSIWNKYKNIGDIENTISLNLVKATYYNGIVSLRYENDISEYISNLNRAYKFRETLSNSGYELTYESDKKYVYKNEDYKVTIMDELGYLIILITEI